MSKNQESIKKALKAGATLIDIEDIAQRADRSIKVLKKEMAARVRNVITKWEHSEEGDYPLKELEDIHVEFCCQFLERTFKSYNECEKLSEK